MVVWVVDDVCVCVNCFVENLCEGEIVNVDVGGVCGGWFWGLCVVVKDNVVVRGLCVGVGNLMYFEMIGKDVVEVYVLCVCKVLDEGVVFVGKMYMDELVWSL